MSKYTFSSKRGKAYYFNSIPGFIKDNPDSILGQLVRHSFELKIGQTDAWSQQIQELQTRLENCGMDGDIIFEYDIVRLGKRIDIVLLIKHMVFSLEFKNGQNCFTANDAQQAEDYALDIKNFHKESENLYVCPILIATEAKKPPVNQTVGCYPDKQVYLQRENIESLIPKVQLLTGLYGEDVALDFHRWFDSPYHPTPTIINAAVEAYSSHDISEIANSEAGQSDIDACEAEIESIIQYAQSNNKKCVCFVTGVPGAGKTLVGLDLVARNLKEHDSQGNRLSVYISGNGPLVEVLREALKKSAKDKKQYDRKTESAINALIQGSFAFKMDNATTGRPIAEKILIFDEAQRVWNEQKMLAKHKNDPEMSMSEPKLLLGIMNRHKDWTVMICLVGLGQDIYDGEVGINEWFNCGIQDFPEWELFYSPKIFDSAEDLSIDKPKILGCGRCHQREALHLSTSIRSFRTDQQSMFVSAVLNNNPVFASQIYERISVKYPVFVTRDYNKAKQWARSQVRGSQRCGVLASSSAQRLKPEGIFVYSGIDVKNWFLAPSDDLRSSNKMEIVAREFDIQGLEIDWAVVCWDLDLRRNNGQEWIHYSFRGTKWVQRKQEEQQRYLVNAYRVLLTRARQGMVIFVPNGVEKNEDCTRDKAEYNKIYMYLRECGIKDLP